MTPDHEKWMDDAADKTTGELFQDPIESEEESEEELEDDNK